MPNNISASSEHSHVRCQLDSIFVSMHAYIHVHSQKLYEIDSHANVSWKNIDLYSTMYTRKDSHIKFIFKTLENNKVLFYKGLSVNF